MIQGNVSKFCKTLVAIEGRNKSRLLHRWLSLVVVVYKVQRYPLSLVAVFGVEDDNQRLLNDHLGSLSNLMLRLLQCAAEDSQFTLTCSTTVKCCYTLRIKYENLRGTKF